MGAGRAGAHVVGAMKTEHKYFELIKLIVFVFYIINCFLT
jgi:hypothetical protein